ncbi:resolvase-like protein [Nonomuraea fuscirosea]|uniref:Resolvase-like protein n=1 Tax=Nonomuraea fuscirosea TaxID=1291556 RepID=A0A2T0MMH8_9ACTN|nr:recombinase family protein [Nonomuraea fuscirosea]PRX59025.1 resolvase-like protein [Nonomuraea fuscirosea]
MPALPPSASPWTPSSTRSKAAGVTCVFSEKISTRATTRPELDKAVGLARELRSAGVAVTLVVHEHKRLGRGLDLAALAEQLRAAGLREQNLSLRDIAARLVITTGKRRGRHPSAATVLRMFRDHDAGIGAAGR